ncbi:endonuclease [Pectobacterium phage PP74]|uniref:HNH homing endonuclease n=1 Tax=Pectobacterium phage PP74 TaxID=1916101 RepID=A0A1J0MEW2_9CAUD|nr:endonuclease [Pectobacterium phage PP74]APD19630.1 HNH homing endonuclease [Pectobacterium phage PP74]
MTLKEKLEAYSKVSPTGCWEWQRSRLPSGYGLISIGHQKQAYAHRVSYREFHGEIPEGLVVRHKCDNPCCCNPEHLEVGTHKDNMQDCKKRGRMVMPPVHIGEANHKTKLTESDVEFILKSDKTLKELAEMFGVTPQAIRWRQKHGRLRR